MKVRLFPKKKARDEARDPLKEDFANLKQTYSTDPYCMTQLTDNLGQSTLDSTSYKDPAEEAAIERLTRRLQDDPLVKEEAEKLCSVISDMERAAKVESGSLVRPSTYKEKSISTGKNEKKQFWKGLLSSRNKRAQTPSVKPPSGSAAVQKRPDNQLKPAQTKDTAKDVEVGESVESDVYSFSSLSQSENEVTQITQSEGSPSYVQPVEDKNATRMLHLEKKRFWTFRKKKQNQQQQNQVEPVQSNETTVVSESTTSTSYSDIGQSSSSDTLVTVSFRISRRGMCDAGEDWNPSAWLSSFFCSADDQLLTTTSSLD